MSQSEGHTKIEQRLSQLDNPWLNPIRETGVVSFVSICVVDFNAENGQVYAVSSKTKTLNQWK